jgi:UDP-glucose 4-epimerase
MIQDKRILITGGAGFIGSYLVEQLAEMNDVVVLDNLSTGSVANLPSDSISFVKGSVTNEEIVKRVTAEADVVVHLAAMMGVRRTLERPLDVLTVNIDGTRAVLDAAVQADVDRVLVASTSEVYGDAPEPPYAETDMTAPKTDYAVAKLADERLTRAYHDKYGLEYTIVRYFNVYGLRQDSSAYGYVVPRFIRQALADDPITVHGTGEQTRDFTFIHDAVKATSRALGPAGRAETFNVGRGREVSIRELAEIVQDTVGGGVIESQPHPRPYIVERRCADISKMRQHLGYTPEYSLEEGIRQMIAAYQDAETDGMESTL